jgi:ankyrin repeat protein
MTERRTCALALSATCLLAGGCGTPYEPLPAQSGGRAKPSKDIWKSAAAGDIEAVEYYLDSGTDVDVRDKVGRTPLRYAAVPGHVELVKLLLRRGANADTRANNGYSPLLEARDAEIALLLIQNGANVNAVARSGWTPLHYASHYRFPGNVEVLLENGADVRAHLAFGRGATPLHAAFLGRGGWDEKTAGIVGRLLENGAKVNARDHLERTPLHYAAHWGCAEGVDLLVEKGADVNVRNNEGRTPLDVAIRRKKEETAMRLRERQGKTGAQLEAEKKE